MRGYAYRRVVVVAADGGALGGGRGGRGRVECAALGGHGEEGVGEVLRFELFSYPECPEEPLEYFKIRRHRMEIPGRGGRGG